MMYAFDAVVICPGLFGSVVKWGFWVLVILASDMSVCFGYI